MSPQARTKVYRIPSVAGVPGVPRVHGVQGAPGPAPGQSVTQAVLAQGVGHSGSLSRMRHRTLAYGVNKTDLDSASGANVDKITSLQVTLIGTSNFETNEGTDLKQVHTKILRS